MRCDHYEALTHDGAVYCVECLPADVTEDSEEVHPVFADSEWDAYPVCDSCTRVHTYVGLTPYGERCEYLRHESREMREFRARHKADDRSPHRELPSIAWPGAYPLYYLLRDGDTLCPTCAEKHQDTLCPIIAYDIHYEGPPVICGECGKEIESAYGDPSEK